MLWKHRLLITNSNSFGTVTVTLISKRFLNALIIQALWEELLLKWKPSSLSFFISYNSVLARLLSRPLCYCGQRGAQQHSCSVTGTAVITLPAFMPSCKLVRSLNGEGLVSPYDLFLPDLHSATCVYSKTTVHKIHNWKHLQSFLLRLYPCCGYLLFRHLAHTIQNHFAFIAGSFYMNS